MSTVQPLPYQDNSSFVHSQTYACLHDAWLSEIHARRLYLLAARTMEENHLHVIAHAFRFTAAQEKEHADIFRGLIAACHGACTAPKEYPPLLLPRAPLDLLRSVIQSERNEWETLYPRNARIATEEGYSRMTSAFLRIAETERRHAQRFLQYANALADGDLFQSKHSQSWLCLSCGQFHSGYAAPEVCPSCGSDRGHFIRSSYYPFGVED